MKPQTEADSENSPKGGVENGKDGTVVVRSGDVLVTDPEGSGKPAAILPAQGLAVFHNGRRLNERAAVSAGDEIAIEAEQPVPEELVKIRESSGGLRAWLTVENRLVPTGVVDAGPVTLLRPQPKTKPAAEILSTEQLRELLEANGITYGIREEALEKALRQPGEPVLAAEGNPPGEPVHGRLECHFDEEVRLSPPKILPDGSVDYRGIAELPVVESGALLAEILPPEPGEPGTGVRENAISPPKAKSVDVRCLGAVRLDEEENKVFAVRAGRPKMRGSRFSRSLEVVPRFIHQGDVDLSTGNLTFPGDVVVTGDVSPSMTVTARGNVEVRGMVSEAEIRAGGSVKVNSSAIKARIRGGMMLDLVLRIRPFLEEIEELHRHLLAAFDELEDHIRSPEAGASGSGNELDRLLFHLVEEKFPKLSSLIEKFREFVEDFPLTPPEALIEFQERIETAYAPILKMAEAPGEEEATGATGLDEANGDNEAGGQNGGEAPGARRRALERLGHHFDGGAIDALEGEGYAAESFLFLSYAHNARLRTAGDITVGIKGAINSRLAAGGRVTVQGVFRGGRLEAGGLVKIKTAGGVNEIKTLVGTSLDGTIYIERAFPGVIVQVGRRRQRLKTGVYKLKADFEQTSGRRLEPD